MRWARPGWLPRWLLWPLLGLCATLLAYLLLVNVGLNTPLGHRLVNLRPEKFQADWVRASSWYPGQVTVTGLRLRGHVRRTLWTAQADTASGRVALLPLLRKEVRVSVLRGRGVSGGVNLIDVIREPPPPRPGGWTLHFPAIEAVELRHAYLDDLVLVGAGGATVGFTKQLRSGPMQVLPSRLRFEAGTLYWRGQALLRQAGIDGQFAIARHRRAEAPGARKLRLTDAQVEIEADTVGLEVETGNTGLDRLQLTPGPGRLEGTLYLARGVLADGSELRLSMPVVADDMAGRVYGESLRATLRSDGRALGLQASLRPTTPDMPSLEADLRIDGAGLPVGREELARPDDWLRRSSGRIEADWHFDSLRWLGALVERASFLKLDGAGTVQADLRIDHGLLLEGSRLRVPGVEASALVMGNRIEGRARAEIDVTHDAQGRAKRQLRAVMERFRIREGRAGRVYVEGRDLRLTVDADGRRGELRGLADSYEAHVAFTDAVVPDLRAYNRYLPLASLRFEGGQGRVSGDLYLDGGGELGHGTLRVRGRRAALRFADVALQGDVDARTVLRRADLQSRQFTLDGSRVDLRGVSFRGSRGAARAGWSARIDLDRARIDLDRPLAARGAARLQMSDVGFLMALYARDKHWPRWVEKIVDAGAAEARSELSWGDQQLVLDDLVASNRRFEVRARLRLQDKQREGSLYARWGVLSLGAELDGGDRDLHLIKAREWYDAQPQLLR